MTAAVAEEAWSSKIPIAFALPCLLLLAMAPVLLLLLLDMLPLIRQIFFRRVMALALLVLLLLLLTRHTSRLRSDDPITMPTTLPRQLSPASRI